MNREKFILKSKHGVLRKFYGHPNLRNTSLYTVDSSLNDRHIKQRAYTQSKSKRLLYS